MLQPQKSLFDPMLTARILWVALSFSTLLYGFVLYSAGKVSGVFIPQNDLAPIEMAALAMNFVALLVLSFHKNKVVPQKDFQKKITGYILCWALNESIAIFGFAAVFTSESGNAFFYVTNLAVALTSNVFTFPRK